MRTLHLRVPSFDEDPVIQAIDGPVSWRRSPVAEELRDNRRLCWDEAVMNNPLTTRTHGTWIENSATL